MKEKPTWLAVVAALIRDDAGRILLQQGLPGKPHAGLWEFPGGKVEVEENPRLALRREVAEELALSLDAMLRGLPALRMIRAMRGALRLS